MGFLTREAFLAHAQSPSGGFYRHYQRDEPLEFIRPVSERDDNWGMRLRKLANNEKVIEDALNLVSIPEMQVIAYMIEVEDKRQAELEAENARLKAKANHPDIIEILFGPDP